MTLRTAVQTMFVQMSLFYLHQTSRTFETPVDKNLTAISQMASLTNFLLTVGPKISTSLKACRKELEGKLQGSRN